MEKILHGVQPRHLASIPPKSKTPSHRDDGKGSARSLPSHLSPLAFPSRLLAEATRGAGVGTPLFGLWNGVAVASLGQSLSHSG